MNSSAISVLVFLILFFTTILRSAIGFGNALIAMPLLVLLLGVKTATPLVGLVGVVIALLMLFRNWREVALKDVSYLLASSLLGLPLGIFFLTSAPESAIRLILGLILIGFGIYNLILPDISRLKNGIWSFLLGFLAGILGGAYNTNGPPIVIFGMMRGWGKEKFRASLQGFFLVSSLIIVAGHGISGLWTYSIWVFFLGSAPFVILAVWLGDRITENISEEMFNRVLYIFLIIVGCLMFL